MLATARSAIFPDMRLIIVSGLSGSGKSVALHALEDLGRPATLLAMDSGAPALGCPTVEPVCAMVSIRLAFKGNGATR